MLDTGPPAVDSVKLVNDPALLTVFKAKDSAGTILQRAMPDPVRRWLANLPVDQLPTGRVILPSCNVATKVTDLCDTVKMPDCAERVWFENDAVGLAMIFAELMEARYLRLRFDVVKTNACRKFHIDTLKARLICTYRGTGTQYGTSLTGQDPAHVFTTATGSPILLRGRLWPEEPDSGLRHRSPPIEGTGETRLVLVLDPIDDPTGEV